jgi:hypothetical protein
MEQSCQNKNKVNDNGCEIFMNDVVTEKRQWNNDLKILKSDKHKLTRENNERKFENFASSNK